MNNSQIKDIRIIIVLVLAIIFLYITFSLQLFNFWLSMSATVLALNIFAISWGGNPFNRGDFNLRAILIGLSSAVILYSIFWLGNLLSQLFLAFAKPQISALYNMGTHAEAMYIILVLLFITSPGEEIFWRNFIQKWAMDKFGGFKGWITAAVIYAGIHLVSGNIMLVMAAFVAGLFWGYIYWQEKNTLAVVISHALWAIGIFILFPVL